MKKDYDVEIGKKGISVNWVEKGDIINERKEKEKNDYEKRWDKIKKIRRVGVKEDI